MSSKIILLVLVLVLLHPARGQHRRKSNGDATAEERRRNRPGVRQRHACVPHAMSEKLLGFEVVSSLGLSEKLRELQQETLLYQTDSRW